jgi:hypothetical protein
VIDISLELPDELMRDYEERASELGITAEELMRQALEIGAPRSSVGSSQPGELDDEAVVRAADIEKEYRRLGYRLGWRFITCPNENAATSKLLLVTLNPAGREVHGPSWSQELGSAYRVESWGGYPSGESPLQRQILQMFVFLGLRDSEVFSAHYVPFRSPSWAELDHKVEAEAVGIRLWQWLKPRVHFDRIVCVGKDKPASALAALFDAKFDASVGLGWGNVTADRYVLSDGRPLIALPHLSRFAVFGRKQSNQPLRELFGL